MASAIKYYTERNVFNALEAAGTVEFTERINDLFDAMNRRHPGDAVRKEGKDILVMKESLQWLNDWERDLNSGVITKEMFLTPLTAEGLRVSILSTLDLTEYLLTECGFKYVLTAKFNQDPLERFFGKVRQAAAENDHPDMPTFLQLYRMLAVYSLLKPPKFGNCEAREEAPVIDFAAFRATFKKNKSDGSNIDMLKAKLDGLIETEEWDCDDIVRHDSSSADVVDAILYYVTGFVSRRMTKFLPCAKCRQSLSVTTTSRPEAALTHCKTRGGLTHPNSQLYEMLCCAENFFSKSMDDCDVFWRTIEHVLDNFPLTFPCHEHKNEAIAKILRCYVAMRMRQHCLCEARNSVKVSQEKKSYRGCAQTEC
ncbi:hypothetical protein HPB49_026133 [Dermacentor silvarum]|nr:hypothetical protein HPB49_026133 [Dermacentor silvarum]